MFYLREVLTAEEGEIVSGVLASKRNAQKPRDLDIQLSYKLETEDSLRKASGVCGYKM